MRNLKADRTFGKTFLHGSSQSPASTASGVSVPGHVSTKNAKKNKEEKENVSVFDGRTDAGLKGRPSFFIYLSARDATFSQQMHCHKM